MMKTENKIKNLFVWVMQLLAGLVITTLLTTAGLWLFFRGLEISFYYRTLVLIGGLVAVLACFTELGLVVVRFPLDKLGPFRGTGVHVCHLALLTTPVWIGKFIQAFTEVSAKHGISAGTREGLLLAACLLLPVVVLSVLQSRFAARYPLPYSRFGEGVLEDEDFKEEGDEEMV